MTMYECIVTFKNAQEKRFKITRHQRTRINARLDKLFCEDVVFVPELNTILVIENVLSIEFKRINDSEV